MFQLPEDACTLAIQQLQTLTGCAKGLTRSSDILFAYDDDDQILAETEKLRRARDDPRIVRLREAIMQEMQSIVVLWSADATTADVSTFNI